MKKYLKYLILLAKIVIVGGIFYFLIKNLLGNTEKLQSLNIKFSYGYAILSLLAALVAWSLTSWNMGRVFAGLNCPLPYKDVFSIYFKSMLGKYLPGKFWQIAGSTYLASQKGVPEGISITAFVGGQIYSLIAGIFFLAIVLIFNIVEFSGEILKYLRWTSIPIILVMIAMVVKPSLFELPMNLLLRLFKRKEVKISIPIRRSFEIFFLFLLSWMVFGLSFWLFANAIFPIGSRKLFKNDCSGSCRDNNRFFRVIRAGRIRGARRHDSYLSGVDIPRANSDSDGPGV